MIGKDLISSLQRAFQLPARVLSSATGSLLVGQIAAIPVSSARHATDRPNESSVAAASFELLSRHHVFNSVESAEVCYFKKTTQVDDVCVRAVCVTHLA